MCGDGFDVASCGADAATSCRTVECTLSTATLTTHPPTRPGAQLRGTLACSWGLPETGNAILGLDANNGDVVCSNTTSA